MTNSLFPSRSIQRLAPETLLEIFDHLFRDARHVLDDETYDTSSLFPFAVASVCRYWLGVLTLKSKYWVNPVVPLDRVILPPVMATYLAVMERQGTIDVHVVHCGQAPIESRTENARVDGVMRLLEPYFARCRTLTIKTHHRSSIVLVTRYLDTHTMHSLENLSLISTIADTAQDAHLTSFTCPNLAVLAIDAKTFVNFVASEGAKGDAKSFDGELNITPYHPDPSSGSAALKPSQLLRAIFELDFVHHFGWLLSLSIEDVAFDDDGAEYEDDEVAALILPPLHRMDDVHLADLHGPFIRSFFISFDPPANGGEDRVVSLTRCSFDVPVEIRNTGVLELCEINDGVDVLSAVEDWDGLELHVEDCPGLHDATMHAMTSERLCPNLYRLSVDNCPLSVHSLERFVTKEGLLERLEVVGGPELIAEDKQKLKESLPDGLTWNGEVIN